MFELSAAIFMLTQITSPNQPTAARSWRNKLFEPVDNSPLIVFRVVFGLLAFLESGGAIATGWVKETFVDPKFAFTFIGFEWLQPLPGDGMYWYYAGMAAFGFLVMIGAFYRISLLAFTLLWSASYLMQKTHYNNHYYLLILLCLLMLCVPANRYFSVDVKRNPALRQLTCPTWCLLIFVLQLGIVYTYAGINKMYPDWLAAKPIAIWFANKTDYPLIGPLLGKAWMPWVVAYGGILFDSLVVPLLLWRKTRLVAFIGAVFFHLFNSAVFQIGIFPYLMLGMMVFFFPPETIRRLFFKNKPALSTAENSFTQPLFWQRNAIVFGFAAYFVVQLLLPLRHHLFPGEVNWTEEGHRLSWRMMLRAKSGHAHFLVKNPATNESWTVFPGQYLNRDQASTMATHPDMVWQFAGFLKKQYQQQGIPNVEIYAISQASLNGRPYQPLIDPQVNLAAVEWFPFQPASWLVPLKK